MSIECFSPDIGIHVAGNAGAKELFELDSIERLSMACPALPLCGLAIGEAERSIPDVNRRLRALLDRLGLPETTTVRRKWLHVSAGCPYRLD